MEQGDTVEVSGKAELMLPPGTFFALNIFPLQRKNMSYKLIPFGFREVWNPSVTQKRIFISCVELFLSLTVLVENERWTRHPAVHSVLRGSNG